LIHTLEPVVGADHVRASVHVEYEMGTSEETQETYDPKSAATLTQEHSEESSTGGAPVGVPGTASNVPSSSPPPAAAASDQSTSRSDASTYAVSKVLHHSVEPPGRLRRIAAAVLVDDVVERADQAGKTTTTRRKRTPEEMKEIEQLARAAIGVDTQRGDVLAVENLSFQETPVDTPLPPAKTERWRKLIEPWSWALRYVGLALLFLVIYLLILRPIKKQALTAFRELPGRISQKLAQRTPEGEGGAMIAGVGAATIEGGGNRVEQLKRTLAAKIKAEPESAGKLLQTWIQHEGKPK
jgi:flagellar M-ring protein FliF